MTLPLPGRIIWSRRNSSLPQTFRLAWGVILAFLPFLLHSRLFAIEQVKLLGNPDFGMTDEAGDTLANNALIRVGSFGGISDGGIAGLLTGDLATVRSNLNSYFATGQAASTNKLWGSTTYNAVFNTGVATLNRASTANFEGFPVYVLVFNSTSITNATQAGIFCYLNDFDGERLPFPAVSSDGVADLEFFSTNFPSGMRPFFGSLGSDKLYRLVPLGQGFGITSTNAIAALVDSEVIYQITANHGATNFSASGLPAGLSVEAASGAFSGSVATAGVYSNIILQAAGLAGTRTSSLTLTITAPLPGTPQITSSTNAQTATAGVAYSFLVTADNAPTSFQAGLLPLGLSLDGATGLISGTPTLPGNYSVVVGASNAIGPGKNSKFTLSVLQPSLAYTNTGFLLGVSSNSPVPVPTAGYSPVSYRKPAGGNWDQVPGLDLDLADGRVTGAPTRAFAPVTLTVEALDGLGVIASGVVTVSSATALPVLSSTNRVDGLTFSPIAHSLTAAATNTTVLPGIFKLLRTSNSLTTNWITATNTTVLPGVTLNESTGALSGSPTQGGTFLAEFAADNSTAKSGEGYSGAVFGGGLGTPLQTTFVIDVTPPTLPNISDASVYLTITNGIGEVRDYASMPVGMTRSFDVANSLATFTTFSNVPSWLQLTTNHTGSGSFASLSGRPTQAGTFTILKVARNTNVAGVTQSTNRELVITVIGSLPSVSSVGFQAPPSGQVGQNYTGFITSAGNMRDPADPSAFNATGLPPGISFASAADRQLGKLTGTPTTAGTYTVKFYIANARGYTTQTTTMTILP